MKLTSSGLMRLLGGLLFSVGPAATGQSVDDLWDVSQGITVTDSSPLLSGPFRFDIYSMFGSTLPGGTEPDNVVFADGNPLDTVHFIEWRTASPVTVTQVVIYAQGQDVTWDYAREHDLVAVRAKSAGSGSYDVRLLALYRRHPHPAVLTVTNVTLVTAQEFRAEFLQHETTSSGPPYGVRNGPRVMELDAFGTAGVPEAPAPTVGIETHAGIVVEGTPGRTYRIEYALTADSAVWTSLTNVVLPSSSFTFTDPAPASDRKRFYRAVEVRLP